MSYMKLEFKYSTIQTVDEGEVRNTHLRAHLNEDKATFRGQWKTQIVGNLNTSIIE